MTHSSDPRSLALETLLRVSGGQYGNLAVDTTIRRHALSDADRGLYTALVYGVIERQVTLDWLLGRFSARPTGELDERVLIALRLGLYQLIYMDRVPDHAAVSETVALLPRRVTGYVNAVLRAYLRFEASLGEGALRENRLTTPDEWIGRFPELAVDRTLAASVAFGVPVPLCRRLADAYGVGRAERILRGFGDKPPITLAANPIRCTTEELIASLAAEGFDAHGGLYAPRAVRVSSGAVAQSEVFLRGDCLVQDEASQLCVAVLDAQPGDLVIDTCTCPGSKAFGAAMSMENQGEIYAFDLHESKLSLVSKGAERLGISIIRTGKRDARDPDPALIGRADRVLCDVPCSGLGVIAKKPEIRHKDVSETSPSAALPAIQAAILEASAAYVKDGGVLVYSTCTILPEENEQVVSAFLATHPEFEPYDFTFPARDPSVEDIVSRHGMVTLLPDANRTDGFFIARIKRNARGSAP